MHMVPHCGFYTVPGIYIQNCYDYGIIKHCPGVCYSALSLSNKLGMYVAFTYACIYKQA